MKFLNNDGAWLSTTSPDGNPVQLGCHDGVAIHTSAVRNRLLCQLQTTTTSPIPFPCRRLTHRVRPRWSSFSRTRARNRRASVCFSRFRWLALGADDQLSRRPGVTRHGHHCIGASRGDGPARPSQLIACIHASCGTATLSGCSDARGAGCRRPSVGAGAAARHGGQHDAGVAQ